MNVLLAHGNEFFSYSVWPEVYQWARKIAISITDDSPPLCRKPFASGARSIQRVIPRSAQGMARKAGWVPVSYWGQGLRVVDVTTASHC